MNNAVEPSPILQPGAWVNKINGLPMQLIAVQNNMCWYSNARSHNMFPMSISEWLKAMRPA